MAILQIKNLTKRFGGLTAVSDVSLDVEKNMITAVIGPNGAGKTTFFNMITGFYEPDGGEILLNDKRLNKLRPDQIVHRGISRTFQNIRLFPEMTALENVMVGMDHKLKAGLMGILFDRKKVRNEEERVRIEAYNLLKYIGIADIANHQANSLPYGVQRRLEIARALAASPSILLLDEPAAGMNPRETQDLTAFIRRLRDDLNLTIILIEHDMGLVMNLSEHICVLDYGQKIAEGTPAEIKNNPRVIEAYLGKTEE